MKIIQTGFPGLLILEPEVHGDSRGWFMESWSRRRMEAAGLHYEFVQDNHSYSAKKGTLRGLHYQAGSMAQAKLVRCACGAIFDVAVDLRKGSPTFLKWSGVELSRENKRQFLIPRGFAHGFLSLVGDVEFHYKVDNDYSPEAERSLRWDDPDVGIQWPFSHPFLSARDASAPFLRECPPDFYYGGG